MWSVAAKGTRIRASLLPRLPALSPRASTVSRVVPPEHVVQRSIWVRPRTVAKIWLSFNTQEFVITDNAFTCHLDDFVIRTQTVLSVHFLTTNQSFSCTCVGVARRWLLNEGEKCWRFRGPGLSFKWKTAVVGCHGGFVSVCSPSRSTALVRLRLPPALLSVRCVTIFAN